MRNRKLTTWGRTITVPESSSKVAKFRFDDLCGRAMSAADYLEITKNFGTIFLLDVPKMGLSEKDLARRFITFIDACYDSKVCLLHVPQPQSRSLIPSEGEVARHVRSADLQGLCG